MIFLNAYRNSQSSLESSGSGSIGTTSRRTQRSPDVRASKAKHTAPSPLKENTSNRDRDVQPYSKRSNEHHVRENGFQEDSHYDTLPGYRLPKQEEIGAASASSGHRDRSLNSDLMKVSQVKDEVTVAAKESDSREGKRNDASLDEPDTTQKDLLNEIDILMGSLVADTEAMFSDAGLNALVNQKEIRSQSLSSKVDHGFEKTDPSGGKQHRLQPERLGAMNRAEQVRHSNRASERKLRSSQRAVNQVLSESKNETETFNKGHSYRDDPADNSTSNKQTRDGYSFSKDMNGEDLSKEKFLVDSKNFTDAPSLIYDRLENILSDEEHLPIADNISKWVEPVPKYTHSPKDQTPSFDFSLSDSRLTSPLGKDNLRDVGEVLSIVAMGTSYL